MDSVSLIEMLPLIKKDNEEADLPQHIAGPLG